MSSAEFSLHDVLFRRTGDHECDVVVFGETVGSVTRRPDVASADPERFHYYAAHLWDDPRGPVLIEDREEVRATIANMLIERNLVPSTTPPMHPELTQGHHRAA